MQTSSNQGGFVCPLYILLDESASMDANGGIDASNRGLPELHSAIASNPILSERYRIGLITFSDIAEELLPLSKLSDLIALPGCIAKGMANYGKAFNLLRDVIDRDITNLKSQGMQVSRPIVIFITNGEPTDDWEASYRALTDRTINKHAPNILPFGYMGANKEVIEKISASSQFNHFQLNLSQFNLIDEPAVVWKSISGCLGNVFNAIARPASPQEVRPDSASKPIDKKSKKSIFGVLAVVVLTQILIQFLMYLF